MKRFAVVALLIVAAAACRSASPDDSVGSVDTIAQSATLAMRRGDLAEAQALVDRGAKLTARDPQSPPAQRFRLLGVEVLLRKHELNAADQALVAELPSGDAFKGLASRREYLRGWSALLQGHRDQAVATLQQARAIAPVDSDSAAEALDIEVLSGVALYQAGRGAQAEATLRAALDQATQQNDRYHQASAQLNLGFGQLVQKRYDAALNWFERVLALTDQREVTVYADALNNAGICYSRLGQFERAVDAQHRALERHENGARREYEQALGQLGSTYRQWNKGPEAIPYLQKALSIAQEAGLLADAGNWAGNLAETYMDLGRWDEAEQLNNQSRQLKTQAQSGDFAFNTIRSADIARARGNAGEANRLYTEALAAPGADPRIAWYAREGLAQVAVSSGRLGEARREFERALSLIENTRAGLTQTDYQLSFLSRLISFYRHYVDALVAQGQIDGALEIADSSRARVLAERQGVTSPSRATASAFKRIAEQTDSVFLSYWLAPEHSYLWVVTPAAVRLVKLPAAADITALVNQHRAAIDNIIASPLAAGGAGDKLFQMLVQPALQWVPKGSRVVIVPDGSLYSINFETLPVPNPLRYWIEDVEVQVAPALAMLTATPPAATRPGSGPSSRSVLIVGNPTPRDPDFPALKFASAEMSSVAKHFAAGRVTSIEGAQAVPASYANAKPDQFAFVHFTAHATTNVESPLDSAVILAGPESGFKLYARDVAAAPLNAELVTVSACRSAGERTYSGEGLIGFAWAFLRGGAKRVIAGLWDVDDKSTAELMDRLYDRVADGQPASAALREAKLGLIARGGTTAQPYYWAPFQLFTKEP